ncbi:Dynein_heavy chain [Hexamita inflata]|uniref:Dynein_heavy chain n=1 Tax=Hexamita inflata TaxID=28002 RepID=A0ABP1HA79_9EUKA
MQDVYKFVKSLLQLRLDLEDAQADVLIQNNFLQQVIQQDRAFVYIDPEKMTVYQNHPESEQEQQIYLLVRTEQINYQTVTRRALASAFQLFEAQNVAVSLYNLLIPIQESVGQKQPQQQELKQSIQKFSEQLKQVDQENLLKNIPFVYQIVDTKLEDRAQIQKTVTALQNLNQIKLPTLQLNQTKLGEDFLYNNSLVKQLLFDNDKIVKFYTKFFARLIKAKETALTTLQNEEQKVYLAKKAGQFENFSIFVAQIDAFKLDIKIIEQYQVLMDQLNIVEQNDYFKLDVQRLKDFIFSQIQNNDCSQDLIRIYKAMYIKLGFFVLSQISKDIYNFVNDQHPGNATNFGYLNNFESLDPSTKQLLRILKLFEQIISSKQSEFGIEPGTILLVDGIQFINQQFQHYANTIHNTLQIPEIKDKVKVLEEALDIIIKKFACYELDQFNKLQPEIQQQLKRQSLILDQSNEIFKQQRFANLVAIMISSMNLLTNPVSGLKFLNDPFQLIRFESQSDFNQQVSEFDLKVSQFIMELKPKGGLGEIMNQIFKLRKLEVLSQSRESISISYQKVLQVLCDQLSELLEVMLKKHKIQKSQLSLHLQLKPEQQLAIDHFTSPLPLFPTFPQKTSFAIQFSHICTKKIEDMRKLSQTDKLTNLIDQISKYVVTPQEMFQIVSPLGPRKNILHIQHAKHLIDFAVDGSITCNRVPELQSMDEDFQIVKSLIFKGELFMEIKKSHCSQTFASIFNAIEYQLYPAVQLLKHIYQSLSDWKYAKEYYQMIDFSVKELCLMLSNLPQYCVRETQCVKILSLQEITTQSVLPFYGHFLDEANNFNQYEIGGKILKIEDLNEFYIQQCEAIFIKTQKLNELYQDFIDNINKIDSYMTVLKNCSYSTISENVENICFVLNKLCSKFTEFKQVCIFVIKQLFDVLGTKLLAFQHIIYNQMLVNQDNFDQSDYISFVQPVFNQLEANQQFDVENVQTQVCKYLEENQRFTANLVISSHGVEFKPSLTRLSTNLINLCSNITGLFLNYSFASAFSLNEYIGDSKDKTFADLLILHEASQIPQALKQQQKIMRRLSLSICQSTMRFAEMYENRQILFNQESKLKLQQKLQNNLEEWLKQYDLLQNADSMSSVRFGLVLLNLDENFKQQADQAFTSLKNFISERIQNLFTLKTDEVESSLNQQLINNQKFTQARLEQILKATKLNNELFELLNTLEKASKSHEVYVTNKYLLEKTVNTLKQRQLEVTFHKIEQNDNIIQDWCKNTMKQITQSNDFLNLIQQLAAHDDELCQKAQIIINGWQEFLDQIVEAKQCKFDLVRNILTSKQTEISDIQQQIQTIGPAVQTISQMQVQTQMPKFKSHDIMRALTNIMNDCVFHSDQVCNDLQKIQSQFQSKCEKKLQNFTPDDIVTIIKVLQEDIKQLNKTVQLSKFYEFFQVKCNMIIKLSQILSQLCNHQVFKKQHWKQLSSKVNQKLFQEDLQLSQVIEIYLENIINSDSPQLKQRIRSTEDILSIANGQFQIEKYLREVEYAWSEQKFVIFTQDKHTLITQWQVYSQMIEEHSSGLTGLQSSPYYSEYQKQAEEWKNKLNSLTEILDTWADVQRRWVYLQSVFSANSKIVEAYLGQVQSQLNQANQNFSQIMLSVAEDGTIIKVLEENQFLNKLEQIGSNLEEVQKALGSFLEKQRSKSPRLFFVGDDDLLDIISITSSPSIKNMQKHWRKMYTGIDRVVLKEQEGQQEQIVGIVSKQNETIDFQQQSEQAQQNPNELLMHSILKRVETGMIAALKLSVYNALKILMNNEKLEEQIMKLIKEHPAQTAVLAYQVVWTYYMNKNEDCTEWINKNLIQISILDLAFEFECKRNILISELTHLKNATQFILQAEQKEFEWLAQLRFEVFNGITNDLIQILEQPLQISKFEISCKMGDSVLRYGFEYHGTDQRIVQTQLTDFCYLIATQAITDKLGCAPQGRAGTGKTESTKALAIQLGRSVLVFNTDENFNEQAVGRILIGACEVGSIACFDEFNRLEENTLSAVCQQLAQIQQGLRNGLSEIPNFLSGSEKATIRLSQDTAIFVTMNPGYAGRRELPDTLKALLRDVAMNKPDLYAITEVMLSSNGFINAFNLAKKIVPFFQLASEQMTNQPHYDWGLRAIKAVLNSAGTILKELKSNPESAENKNIETEAIIGAIIDAVVPKLIQVDIDVFNCLLLDIFPGAKLQPVEDQLYKKYVIEIIQEKNLILTDLFVTKIMQIFRCQQVNIGLMLVGSTGTSKSEALGIFVEAMDRYQNNKMKQLKPDWNYKRMVKFDILCPKSFTGKEDLFGSLEQTTREWQDGQFTSLLRSQLTEIAESDQSCQIKKQYIICFDSYIDPEWVESLNSVLDDNRCLTLPNGERLAVPQNIHLIFEVKDLKNATPATVSRCSMIWFAKEILPNNIRFEGFVQKIDKIGNTQGCAHLQVKLKISLKQNLINTIHKLAAIAWRLIGGDFSFIDELIGKCQQQKLLQNEVMIYSDARLITTITSLLEASLKECIKVVESCYPQMAQKFPQLLQLDSDSDYVQNIDKQQELLNHTEMNVNKLMLFMKRKLILSVAWGFCCAHNNKYRFLISKVIFEHFKAVVKSDVMQGLDVSYENENINSNTILQYNVTAQNEQWQHNSHKLQKTVIQESQVGNSVIQTLDTVTYGYLIESWLKSNYPLILVGPAGSGKSMSLTSALRNTPNFEMVFISFSSNTTPEYVKKLIIRNCEKSYTSQGIILQPKVVDQTLVIMCDEINLPSPDAFGCQRTIEFIRSTIENKSFYDPLTKQTYILQRIAFAGTCNPPTDPGRYHMCERFLSHAPVFLCDFPTYDSLNMIYSTFVQAVLANRAPQVVTKFEIIAQTMVDIYTAVSGKLTVEQQQHYIYSPRELTRWCRGLITGLSPEQQYTINDLAKLVFHEGLRLFEDRLVLSDERQWILQEMNKIVTGNLGVSRWAILTPIYSFLQNSRYESTTIAEVKQLLQIKEKSYHDELLLSNPLAQHIVLTDEVIETILKIDRVIKQPVGHLLLVGISGVGKTTLAKFTAWLNNYECYDVQTHKKYTLQDFEELLRMLVIKAGVKQIKLVFLFDEANALETTFLEHMNALLASGEVPGLFEGDQLSQLLQQARDQIEKFRQEDIKNLPPQSAKDDQILNFITKNVQNNLHIVFSMNPPPRTKSQSGLQSSAASSPALFNRCVIVWMGDWQFGSYYQMASEKLNLNLEGQKDYDQPYDKYLVKELNDPGLSSQQQNDLLTNIETATKDEKIRRAFVLMHKKCLEMANYIEDTHPSSVPSQFADGGGIKLATPRNFVKAIHYLLQIYDRVQKYQKEQFSHVQKGLLVLQETQNEVKLMQQELNVKTVQLTEARDNSDKKLAEMSTKKQEAQQNQIQTNELLKVIKVKQEEIDVKKGPIQKELAEAQPAVDAAKKAITGIDRKKLDELKMMAKPPENIRIAMEAVVLIVGDEADRNSISWESVKKTMRKPDFLSLMTSFDPQKTLISNSIQKKLREQYFDKITVDQVNRASQAAGPMFQWAVSVSNFQEIVAKIEPLTNEINRLEQEAAELNQQFTKSNALLQQLQVQLTEYEIEYKQLLKKQTELDQEKQRTETKLNRAAGLVNSLQSESERWSTQCQEFQTQIANQIGDQILISFYSSYALILPEQLRRQIYNQWTSVLDQLQITFSENLIISEALMSEVAEKTRWIDECGLQNDQVSLENMCSLLGLSQREESSIKFYMDSPGFLINTSSNFKEVLQKIFGKQLQCTSTLSQDLQQIIERSLRFGQILYVENCEEYDPILNTCIEFALDVGGCMQYISNRKLIIAGREIEASPGFRLILQMNSSGGSKQIPPSVIAQCKVLNFAVTQSSFAQNIQQQLLEYERPSVGKERQQLLVKLRQLGIKLVELEKQLLNTISNTDSKQILESDVVSSVLQNTKQEAQEVNNKKVQATELCENLETASTMYKDVSSFISSLYFSLQKLPKIQYCAYFPMSMFLYLFEKTLKNVGVVENEIQNQAEPTQQRMKVLALTFTKQIYYSGGPSKCFFELGRRMKFII